MNKAEVASYLSSLSSLLKDQDTSGVHQRSQVLGAEFDKHWSVLKQMIEKDNEDETRKREHSTRSEERHRDAHSERGSG